MQIIFGGRCPTMGKTENLLMLFDGSVVSDSLRPHGL